MKTPRFDEVKIGDLLETTFYTSTINGKYTVSESRNGIVYFKGRDHSDGSCHIGYGDNFIVKEYIDSDTVKSVIDKIYTPEENPERFL